MNLASITAQLFLSTVRIEGRGPACGWTGTGFFYSMPFRDSEALVVVSNKHVLLHADELRLHLLKTGPDGGPAFGQVETMVLGAAECRLVAPHPDPAVDVAVLVIGQALRRWVQQFGQPALRSVGVEQLFDPDRDRVEAVDEVTFVGYPNGLFDSKSGTPIARRGVTATPITLDYEGRPAFLVDAPVFGGSSGSPVYSIQGGMRPNLNGALVLGEPERASLLGVLAAVHVRQVSGIVQALPAAQIVGEFSMQQELDLGIVFRSSTIEECCQLVRASAI